MGIYLNPGLEGFKKILSSGNYVDKTGMISVINSFIDKGNSYICISRPRRFGKTFACNMLNAYYSKGCDSKDVFSSYRIAQDPDFSDPNGRRNKMNVIKIDLNSEYQNARNKSRMILRMEDKVKSEMKKEFVQVEYDEDDSLAEAIQKTYFATGETFIILIDEYDVLVREKANEELFGSYLSFLNGLFKSDTLRPAISLAYLTGILPVVRDKVQSKLNNFEEYTILDAYELSEFIGFTSDEVKQICAEYDMDFEECKRWYDGYHQHGFEIYNPESVIKSMMKKTFDNYWGKTSSYEAITDRITQNFEGTQDDVIKMISGESVDVNVTSYLNTMNQFKTKDDLFTYLIHLGYLAYDIDAKTCHIPNGEVRREWINAIAAMPDYKVTDRIIKDSQKLLEDTIAGDIDAVSSALDRSHIHVTSNRSYNNEDALASSIYLAYIYALNAYTVVKEMTAGKGFADVVFIPYKASYPAMIIELKRNSSTESAMSQIKEKKYFESLASYQGELLFVGINYDEKEKTHTCEILHFDKE